MALEPELFDALIDTVRRFVAERLRPLEAEVEAADAIPDAIVEEMKALGLFGLSIAEEHGGLGLTMAEEARVAIELGRTTPAFRSAFGTNVGIGSQGLVLAGTPEQKAHWLPKIARGAIITSFALTEPDVGSDSGSVKTRAVRDGDVYRLSGTKRYITNADKAQLFTVMARTGAEAGGRGVSAFLVPRDLPGVSIGEPEKKMGQKGARVADVRFDDVPVPVANRLGAEGEGFRIAMQVLDRGRLHIAAVCVGVAERLIADCVAYASERRQFGKPIAEHQLIQACWRIRRPRHSPPARWCWRRQRRRMPVRTRRWRPRRRSISPARWSAASPIARCRSSAVPAISPITGSSGCTATCGCSASTKAPARSSN